MDLDPLAIRNLLLWVAFALGSTILLGGVPSWMRCAARRADPSAASALFALFLAAFCAVLLQLTGGVARAVMITPAQLLWIGVCGFLSALAWLSLFTALTGGKVSKVLPVFLLLGLGTRYAALALFVFNVLAVVSYPELMAAGLKDHQVWGLLLLITMCHGPGKLSLDHLIGRLVRR